MSREPDRIGMVLDELEEYWRRHPDVRLGQIVSNISQRTGHGKDPFYMEDSEALRQLKEANTPMEEDR